MKKIIFACVASALLLAGCGNNNDKEKYNSTETSATITTIATESYSEITEDTVTTVTYETASGITTSEITTTRATHSDRKKETTIIKSTKKQNPANNFSDDTVQEELPIINEETQKSEVKVTSATTEKTKKKVTTTAANSTESVSTSVCDDVIELPFVPVR